MTLVPAKISSTAPVFIRPMVPRSSSRIPSGEGWTHEVKFDGFRVQVHIAKHKVTIFSRNGHDFTRRFRTVTQALEQARLPDGVLDGEVVACGSGGRPDFQELMKRHAGTTLCLVVFDLLWEGGRSLLQDPLHVRRTQLQRFVKKSRCVNLQYSEAFDDPAALMAACEKMGLEGLVSKKRDSTYRSGPSAAWIKVKTVSWRTANRDRYKQFQKRDR